MPVSTHASLKEATADLHREVEEGFSALDLTRSADYRRFLAAHALVIPSLERTLERSGVEDWLPDWPARARRAALKADLERLDTASPPVPAESACLNPAEIFGASYVLEGSRLGAQVVLRTVMSNADPAARAATSFLRHGSGARLWPAFLQRLNEEVTGAAATADAIAAARGVFARFVLVQRPATSRATLAAGM